MTTSIVSVDSTTSKFQVNGSDSFQFKPNGVMESIASINGGQLAGLRNRIINGNFGINQRTYASGAAVGTNLYGHDRWKMAASGDTYTFSTTANVTTVTIPASKVLQQVIEGLNLESGTYTLSWSGTAQGKIGAGSYGASGVTGVIVGGTNTTIEFGPGAVSKVQLELGTTATVFEQRPYGMELALCQRYAWALTCVTGNMICPLLNANTVTSYGVIKLPVSMRAAPALTFGGISNVNYVGQTGSGVTTIALTGTSAGLDQATVVVTGAGFTAGQAAYCTPTASMTAMIFSAEL